MFLRINLTVIFLSLLLGNIGYVSADVNSTQGYISVRANLLKGVNQGRCNAFNIIGSMILGNFEDLPVDGGGNPLVVPTGIADECAIYGVTLNEDLVEEANVAVISAFSVSRVDDSLTLDWTSVEESGISVYVIDISILGSGVFQEIGGDAAAGAGASYSLTDVPDLGETYVYRLRAVFEDGSFEVLGSVTVIFDF